jgi:hypothetical protein
MPNKNALCTHVTLTLVTDRDTIVNEKITLTATDDAGDQLSWTLTATRHVDINDAINLDTGGTGCLHQHRR